MLKTVSISEASRKVVVEQSKLLKAGLFVKKIGVYQTQVDRILVSMIPRATVRRPRPTLKPKK